MSYRSKPRTPTDADSTGPTPRGGDGNDALDGRSTDLLFEVLSHEYRRTAIAYITEQDEAIPLDDLFSAVVDGCEWPEGSIPAERESRVAAGFYHSHLGKLRDAGMVVYDPTRKTIRPTECAVHAAHLLDGL